MTPEERFWPKVDRRGPDECWPWLAGINDHGYGTFWTGTHKVRAHRFAYEALVGPIPKGHDLDHLCHTDQCPLVDDCPHRACCNPAHHEPKTRRANLLRGNTLPARQARQKVCPTCGSEYRRRNTPPHTRYCAVCRARQDHDRHLANQHR